jgi:hypothetical protein
VKVQKMLCGLFPIPLEQRKGLRRGMGRVAEGRDEGKQINKLEYGEIRGNGMEIKEGLRLGTWRIDAPWSFPGILTPSFPAKHF